MTLLGELAEPFERMTPAEASAILRDHYGISADALERLDTERDDTFRAGRVILKVAHPDDDAALVDLQTEAMEQVAARGLPVQRLVRTRDGADRVTVNGRVARVVTWLDGTPLGSLTSAQLRDSGAMLGRLSAALADFAHPAAHRTFAWDLQSFEQLASTDRPAITDVVFERFARLSLDDLPHQVIHNDFHPGNVLGDATAPGFVVGVLDFGDALYSARVADLGVSLAYFVPPSGDPWAVLAPFVEGYESVVPLGEAERAVIPTLVAARLVQRIVLPPLLEGRPVSTSSTTVLENFLKET